jgi:hypothetical protein
MEAELSILPARETSWPYFEDQTFSLSLRL